MLNFTNVINVKDDTLIQQLMVMDWICQYCTYRNVAGSVLCSMCGSENPLNRRHKSNGMLSNLPSISESSNSILNVAKNVIREVINPGSTYQQQPIQNHHQQRYSKNPPDWICPKCYLSNALQATICGRCNFHRSQDVKSKFWICQKCHLQQPIPPIDLICPLCNKKAHNQFYVENENRPIVPPRTSLPVIENTKEIDDVYNNIMEFCRHQSYNFIDDSFPHSQRSIGDLSKLEKKITDIVWLRPAEIYTKDGRIKPWTVFYDPKPTDIEQGLLGNCWFLSALAVIAERPDLLSQIVITNNYNAIGVYKIRLCIDGLWKTVLVDDFFPCHSRTKSMIFAVGRYNQLWVSLIEKGLAKIYGNYASLRAGRTVEGFSILTGSPCEHIDLEVDLDKSNTSNEIAQLLEMIWVRLLSAKEANFLMGCSCGAGRRVINQDEYKKLGLMTRHAYSILDVKQHGQYKLLRLRNPWGRYTWKGEWSLGWSGWNDYHKRVLYYEKVKHEPGTFWIPYELFIKYFDSVELAHIKNGMNWSDKRFPFNISWRNTKVLKITVTEPTEICFTLFQRNARTTVDQVDIMLLVHKEDSTGQPGKLITKSSRRCLASIRTDDMFFEPGQYIICSISFTNFVELKDLPVTLVMHSGKAVEARLEQSTPDILRQSLVQMMLSDVIPVEYLNNVKVYQMTKHFSGIIMMVENLHENHCVQIKADCSKSQNILSSRGELIVADCIPPLHRQIIVVLTHFEASQPYMVQHQLNQRTTRNAKLLDLSIHNPDSQNEPGFVNGAQIALHGPKPLYL